MTDERQNHFDSWDAMGEVEARHHIGRVNYTGRHGEWAREWIASRDQAIADAREASSRAIRDEEIAIARSAADAAWEAARAAKNANTIATVALIAAVIAIAISIISAFVQHH